MELFKVLRHTEDWSQLNIDNYWDRNQDHLHFVYKYQEEAERLLRLGISRWERLSMTWFQYRCRIKELMSGYDNVPLISIDEAIGMLGDKNVVFLPMDDDDLVRADTKDLIYKVFEDSSLEGFDWRTWCYTLLPGREVYFVEHGPTLSNCYAIRADAADEMALFDHLYYVKMDINKHHTENLLGLRFIHPASMYKMQRGNTLKMSMYGNIKRSPIPDGLEWASEVIDEVYLLTNSLRPVVKI